jgi:RES domain-containing protein
MHVSYHRDRWPELFNASRIGNARFSPLLADGAVIPTMYLAATQTVALLESAFHEVHQIGTRIISERLRLATRGVVALTVPKPLPLIDLTDEGLHRVALARAQLVSTTPQHYACTRAWAATLHGRRVGPVTPVGLLWRSRIAELAEADSLLFGDLLPLASDVCALFGDRVSPEPAVWQPGDPHYDDLSGGDGRLLAEQIADQLGAVIVP